MKAEIKPLEGKYYGTIIQLSDDDMYENQIKIWCFSGGPSLRQIEYYDLKPADKNSERWNDLFCDTHYETERTYLLAKIIVEAINAHAGLLEWVKINSLAFKSGTIEIKYK